MAPELALEALRRAPRGATVLDPMCGSGTVLKLGVEEGWGAIGFDLDPLAVLISRVASRPINVTRVKKVAEAMANQIDPKTKVAVPWIDGDHPTSEFVNFWFANGQSRILRQFAALLINKKGATADLLRVALSRTIITKDRGASLARDVSHSRPHRVRDENDYDVVQGFLDGVNHICGLVDREIAGTAAVALRDARQMPAELNGTVDLVITSPPYLNAIDYMRGHRLSLVWLGHQLGGLRIIRSQSVGSERSAKGSIDTARALVPRHRKLLPRQQAMLDRYAIDMATFTDQIAMKLTPKGEAVVVVGDSIIQGAFVKNSRIVEKAAMQAGLKLVERRSRRLPSSSRYLPPPAGEGPMSMRMRSEVVLHFTKDPVSA